MIIAHHGFGLDRHGKANIFANRGTRQSRLIWLGALCLVASSCEFEPPTLPESVTIADSGVTPDPGGDTGGGLCDVAACGVIGGTCDSSDVCLIQCTQGNSCDDAICPENHFCRFSCSQGQCNGIDCAMSRGCYIDCSARNSCSNTLACGEGPCTVDCKGQGSCTGNVECGDSCACDIDCGPDAACSNEPVCPNPRGPGDCGRGPKECSSSSPGCDTCFSI